ncbi:unnamed protein product [Spodoptera exigua]|nr:unnamed protein product [Spodoptera exigua]
MVFKGMRVAIREHPYVASIRRNFMHYSVATMLTKNLFVTVAHPLIDVPLYELAIVVGENYADRGATLLTVLLVIVHEAFDKYTLAADIALLRVFEDLSFRHVYCIDTHSLEKVMDICQRVTNIIVNKYLVLTPIDQKEPSSESRITIRYSGNI